MAMSARRSAVAGIVLAAGKSARFGGNKLVAPFRGEPLLRRPVEAARASRLERIVVVLGNEAARVESAIADLVDGARVRTVVNPAYDRGQGGSVVAGLGAVGEDFPAAMFLMGDQPLLDAAIIDDLIAAHERTGKAICFPLCRGRRRNPVLFAARFFPDILRLTGDVGARALIDAHREAAAAVEYADEAPFRDVDRLPDLERLEAEVR